MNTVAQMLNTRSQRDSSTSSFDMFWTVRNATMGKHRPKVTSAAKAASLMAAGQLISPVAEIAEARAGAALAQTFSTAGRPRMPVGRKIRVMARIEKAATSL